MKILLFIMVFAISCTNQKHAQDALDGIGFTDIVYTGYKWFSCSEDDWYHTGFMAINSKGKKVYGTVCSGLLFKNSTVRFD